jgi:hypothetical protein
MQSNCYVGGIVPARPNLGTSFSSFTTMLRSASFAFFEMLRVCCGPQTSKFCRVTLRIHDVHCGSSVELLNEAIARVDVWNKRS